MQTQVSALLTDLTSIFEPALLVLLAAWLGYRFGFATERRNKMRSAQLVFVPGLKTVITQISEGEPLLVRQKSHGPLRQNVWEFRMHLKGRELRAFDKAWNQYEAVPDSELFPYNNPGYVAKPKHEEYR